MALAPKYYNDGTVDYGGYEPTGKGGGTVTPGNVAGTLLLIPDSGGLTGVDAFLLIPIEQDVIRAYFMLDPFDLDTEEDVEIHFKQEDISIGKKITTSKVLLQYRNLGVTKIVVTIVNGDGKQEKEWTIGNDSEKLGEIMETEIPFVTTGTRPQLRFLRRAGEGAFSLIRATMVVETEQAPIL